MIPASISQLGERPWLVLGGGGLKGLAHIGAWRAIQESSFEPAGVVGTSIGAVMACCFAGNVEWRELDRTARRLTPEDIVRVNRRAGWIHGVKQQSVLRGDVLRDFYQRILPPLSWEETPIPAQVNAVSLRTGESVWFGRGGRTDVPVVDAVLASSALPVLFPPVQLDGEYYVDGGTVDMLGLDRAAELGATGILAVDTGAGGEEDPEEVVDQGLVGIQQRVFAIMSAHRRREKLAVWSRLPVTLVRPTLDGLGVFDFSKIDYFLEEGYRAAKAAL